MNQQEANRRAKDIAALAASHWLAEATDDPELSHEDNTRVMEGVERVIRDLRWRGQRQYVRSRRGWQ